MLKNLKKLATTVAATGALATAAFAGELVITYDDLNPNPESKPRTQ